jgi:hypothetical protein
VDVRSAAGRVGRRAVAAIAALASALAPAAGRAAALAPTPSLAVSAVPAVLAPGVRSVAIRVGGCEGAPAVGANVGTVSGVEVVAPGRAQAEYRPPPEARPQIAIVTATCGDRHGWTTVPIVGRGIAVARTDPGASISVTIGTRRFGPAVADGHGVARVAVEVPPGVRFAHQGERPLDLRVPPAQHVHVVAHPPEVRADREETVRVLAYAITPAGAPRSAAPLRLAASAGALPEPVEVAPGVWLARWTLPAGPAGQAVVEARLEDDPGPAASVEVARRPGPPARIDASADRAVAVAGEAPVQLDVSVVDAAGNPTPADLRVEPHDAVLDRRELEPGRWAIGLEVPELLLGRTALDVSVVAGEVAAAASVRFDPAPAVTLAVEPSARDVVADGEAALALRVKLQDRFGNPVLDPPPAATTHASADVAVVRDGDAFRLTVRPRRRLAAGEETVTITGAGRTELLPVTVRSTEPRLAVAARAGWLAATGALRAPYASVEATLWPWGRYGLSLEAGAFADARGGRVSVDGAALELRGAVRYLPLVLSARWRGTPSAATVLLAGAGGLVSAVAGEVRVAGQPPVRENGLAAGGQLSFGAGRRLGAGTAFVEVRSLWIADPGIEPVHGRVVALGLTAGWAHGLL